jgi:cation/acetate symporter
LGIFWKRANQQGAIAGMMTGLTGCVYYMFQTHPLLGGSVTNQWFSIAPVSAGIFGVPAGVAAIVMVSLLTPPPNERTQALIDHIRRP